MGVFMLQLRVICQRRRAAETLSPCRLEHGQHSLSDPSHESAAAPLPCVGAAMCALSHSQLAEGQSDEVETWTRAHTHALGRESIEHGQLPKQHK